MIPGARFSPSPSFVLRLFAFLLFLPITALLLYGALMVGPSAATSSAASALVIPLQAPHDGTEPLPPGVSMTTILPSLSDGPVSMAFDPQGRLFFTEKGETDNIGSVRLYANGVLQGTPVITFSADGMCSERGLLGIAIDPDFNSNHYIYVYYTAAPGVSCGATQNRVARFVEALQQAGDGRTARG